MGVVIDQNFKFHQQAAAAAAKANHILGLISKCFEHLDIDTLPLLYKTLVLPILEYVNAIWGPYYRMPDFCFVLLQFIPPKLAPSLFGLLHRLWINDWSSLPDYIVNANSLMSFKQLLGLIIIIF